MKIIRNSGETIYGSKANFYFHVYPEYLETTKQNAAIALAYLFEYLQEFVLYGEYPSRLSKSYSRYDPENTSENGYSKLIFDETQLITGYLHRIAFADSHEESNRLLAELVSRIPVLGEFLPDIETVDTGEDEHETNAPGSAYDAWTENKR